MKNPFEKSFVFLVAICWSIFQLLIAQWIVVDSSYVRSIHLAFALLLAFSIYPSFKKRRKKLKFTESHYLSSPYLSERLINYLLAALFSFSALYYFLYFEQISLRAGNPQFLDIAFGILLVLGLLEACRRVIGLTLSLVALTFILYSFLGPYFPDFLSFKGISLSRFIGQVSMTDEGIYGIPLDVSANVVFLFVLFGKMLEKIGGGEFFIKLSLSLVGAFKGGPAKAAVLGSGLTGMISGSSIANIVTTGNFTIPMMKKAGYPPTKAAAIEVAASTDGQLAPPIMGAAAFIIASTIPNTTYFDVIKSAFVPAFASYAALFFLTHLEAGKLGISKIQKKDLFPFFQTLKSGFYFLLPIFVLLYLLIIEQATPVKSVFYSISLLSAIVILQPFFEKKNKKSFLNTLSYGFKNLFISFENGAKGMISVALATAGSGIIIAVVSLGLGGQINEIIFFLSQDNIFLMLFITALSSLIIGMGLPTTATYVVISSLIAPAIVYTSQVNGFIVPLIATHLFCFYFGILADDTPPVGLASYAASAIAQSEPIKTGIQAFSYDIRTAILPFVFIFDSDVILYNIDSWPLAVFICIMVTMANFAFVSAIHNFLIVKNTFFEAILLLLTALIMMFPKLLPYYIPSIFLHKYFSYLIGLFILFFILFLQFNRKNKSIVH